MFSLKSFPKREKLYLKWASTMEQPYLQFCLLKAQAHASLSLTLFFCLPSPSSPRTLWIWVSCFDVPFVPPVGAPEVSTCLWVKHWRSLTPKPCLRAFLLLHPWELGTDYSWQLRPSMHCPPISIRAWLLVIYPCSNRCCSHISLSQGGQGFLPI